MSYHKTHVAGTVVSSEYTYASVADFGAVGNGITDDTAAIQAAIDAVTPTGGRVAFPSGDFRITSTLKIDSAYAVQLVGAGCHDAHLFWKGTMIISEVVGYALEIHASYHIYIADIGFRSPTVTIATLADIPTDHNGIYLYASIFALSTQQTFFERVDFGFFNKALVLGKPDNQSDRISINDCKWMFCRYGIYCATTNLTAVVISGMRAWCCDASVFLERSGGPITIIGSDSGNVLAGATYDSFVYAGGLRGPVAMTGCQAEGTGTFINLHQPTTWSPFTLNNCVINLPMVIGYAGITNADPVTMTGCYVTADINLAGHNARVTGIGNIFNAITITLNGADSVFFEINDIDLAPCTRTVVGVGAEFRTVSYT